MKKSKIIVSLLLAAVMVLSVVVMVACNGGGKDKAKELILWAPSGAQAFYREWADKWAESYEDSAGNKYTVELGIMSEGDAGTNVMNAPEDAADVFLFADDQISKLVAVNGLSSLGDPTKEGTRAKKIADRNLDVSAQSATWNGQLYGYPMQADNCYFLYYNSKVLSATDVQKWDTIWSKVEQLNQGKTGTDRLKVQFDFGNAWYQAAWFFTFGGTADTKDTNFNTDEVGLKALKAAYQFSTHQDLYTTDPDSAVESIINGSTVVGVAGTWVYNQITEGNPDIKLAVLPKVTFDGQDYDMKSFFGSKLIGVNGKGPNQEAAHALADFLTDKDCQIAKISALTACPSNKEAAESEAAKASPVLSVINGQRANSYRQGSDLPAGLWDALPTCVNACKLGAEGNTTYFPNGVASDTQLRTLLAALREGFKLAE